MNACTLLRAALACTLAAVGCGAGDDAPGSQSEAVLVARTVWVSPDGDDAADGRTTARPMRTIQAAVDRLGAGGERAGTVRLMPGTYTDTLSLVGFAHVRIVGDGRDTVRWRPAAALAWDVAGYGASRRTPVRVVDSRDVTLRSVTLDLADVRGDQVAGLLLWNSTATVQDCVLTDMATPGYYEFTVYASAPGFSAAERATVRFVDDEFVRTGRVGVLLHGFTHGEFVRNAFRAEGDFGYGVEVSSSATADLRSNDIAGYDVTAATDGSGSAGVLVDNAFTAGNPHLDKRVTLRANHLHANTYAVSVGNAFPGLSGDVDIDLRLDANLLHANRLGAVSVTDANRSAGSSVTVTARGNLVADNHGAGYVVSTAGDGEVHLDLAREVISGHDVAVDVLPDTGASLHDVRVTASNLGDNLAWGVRNLGPSVVAARGNWWGAPDGPTDAAGDTDVTRRSCDATSLAARVNLLGDDVGRPGIAVTDNVDYCAWSRAGRP